MALPVLQRDWPEHADEPFGDVMNSIKKYVVSNSLQAAEWQNSEIISGDVAQKLTDLKAQDGGDITMSGPSRQGPSGNLTTLDAHQEFISVDDKCRTE